MKRHQVVNKNRRLLQPPQALRLSLRLSGLLIGPGMIVTPSLMIKLHRVRPNEDKIAVD